MTGTRAKGIIAICWVLSFAIGLTPMLGWNNCSQQEGRNGSQVCRQGQVACLFEDVVPMDYMVYYNFFACVLVPLLVMLGVYLRIFLAARRQLKQTESQPPPPGERARSTLQKEVHAAKSLAIIVGLFALCWLPLHVINCFTFFCPSCGHAPAWLMYLTIVLSHGNSVVNPFIYAYRIREFRHTFRRILRSHVLRRRRPRDITTTATPAAEAAAAATCSASRSIPTGSRRTLSSPLSGTTSACSTAANPTSSGSPRWRGRRRPGRTSGPL